MDKDEGWGKALPVLSISEVPIPASIHIFICRDIGQNASNLLIQDIRFPCAIEEMVHHQCHSNSGPFPPGFH